MLGVIRYSELPVPTNARPAMGLAGTFRAAVAATIHTGTSYEDSSRRIVDAAGLISEMGLCRILFASASLLALQQTQWHRAYPFSLPHPHNKLCFCACSFLRGQGLSCGSTRRCVSVLIALQMCVILFTTAAVNVSALFGSF